jgi:PAS domain S-box-containing protein
MSRTSPEPAAGLICGAQKTAAVTARRQSVLYALPFPDGERWFEASIAVQGDPRAPASRLVFLARDVTARKRAETALRESEEKYRLLTEGMKDVVWVLDVESRRFTYVSPSVKNLRGYTADEVRAQPLEAAWTPEERERLFHLLQGYVADFLAGRITEETYVSIEFHQPCKDGSAVPSEAICHLVRSRQTGRLELHGVTRDVAARARVERALRESETRFAEATRQSRAFVWEVDAEGRYMFVTPVVEDVLGYRPEELAGRRHFYDLHPAKGRDEFRTAVFAAMERREKFRDYENPMVAKDGRTMWVSTNAVPLLDKDGALLGYRGVDFDVTARKLAEDALRESEARTRAVQDNLPDGLIYQIDSGADGQARRFTFLSQGVERLHGVSAADALLDPMAIYGQVLPEDLRDVAAREAQAAKTLTPLRVDVRVRLPSGEIRWRRFTSAPRRLPNGHLVWDGIEIDVTERKHAEEALRESEARFAATTQASRAYVWEVAPDGLVTFISPMVEKVLGRRPEEIVGQLHFYDLPPQEDREQVKRIGLEAMARRETIRGFENRNVAKDGRIVWLSQQRESPLWPRRNFPRLPRHRHRHHRPQAGRRGLARKRSPFRRGHPGQPLVRLGSGSRRTLYPRRRHGRRRARLPPRGPDRQNAFLRPAAAGEPRGAETSLPGN